MKPDKVKLTKEQILQVWDAINDHLLIETNEKNIRNFQAIKVLIYSDVSALSHTDEATFKKIPGTGFEYPFAKIAEAVHTAPHLLDTMQLICSKVKAIESGIITKIIKQLGPETDVEALEPVQDEFK